MKLKASELILNDDGSVYHLHLLPEQIAQTILTVGDPDRVGRVSQHFDTIEHKVQKREFVTHTGTLNGKRLSVISTGIGTDNIDIVLNELDALVNIDLKTRTIKEEHTRLDFIRIGTSGTIQPHIPVDSLLVSSYGLGLDALMQYYHNPDTALQDAFLKAWQEQMDWPALLPYFAQADTSLVQRFPKEDFHFGITASCCGFYAPQGRILRAKGAVSNLTEQLAQFSFQEKKITNLEMETSALIGLGNLLGHRATAVNAILANRATGQFSKDPGAIVELAIKKTLDLVTA